MPSSTSNFSKHRAPPGPAGRVVLATVLFTLLLVGSLEAAFRAQGFEPSFQDTARLWGEARAQVSNGSVQTIALLGSSRTQQDVVPSVLEEELPGYEVRMLAAVGSSPLPVLEHLAADPDFKGIAFVEVYPHYFFSGPEANDRIVESWIEAYRDRAFIEPVEARLRHWLQQFFVVGRVETRPTKILYDLATTRRLPTEHYVTMFRNRYHAGDYTVDGSITEWGPVDDYRLSADELTVRYNAISENVKTIRARGGDVIFFRMLTSGAVLKNEQDQFPRATYWERLTEEVPGHFLHFADVPAMKRFDAPDGRHLDFRASPAFTRVLATELRKLGLVSKD